MSIDVSDHAPWLALMTIKRAIFKKRVLSGSVGACAPNAKALVARNYLHRDTQNFSPRSARFARRSDVAP
jgi:hypothetical protein